MKELKRVNKVNKLYHLSVDNHDGETFHPRVPDSRQDDEDDKLNRVCFSNSMSGCFRAIFQMGYNDVICYVHVPININPKHLYKPSEKLVCDVNYTNEHWYRKPVKMKCIGKARFTYTDNIWSYNYIPPVKIKWIEKYE